MKNKSLNVICRCISDINMFLSSCSKYLFRFVLIFSSWIFLKPMSQGMFVWILETFVLFYRFNFKTVSFMSISLTITPCASIVWWIFGYNSWSLKMLKFQSHFSIAFSFWLLPFCSNSFWYHFCRLKILKNQFSKREKHIFSIWLIDFIHLNCEASNAHIAHALSRSASK